MDTNGLISEIDSWGGGIHTEFSDMVISNSIIRNNYADGAGNFISKYCSATVVTVIHSNISYNAGGGFYIYTGSGICVTNCLIYKNRSVAGGGGGGLFLVLNVVVLKS